MMSEKCVPNMNSPLKSFWFKQSHHAFGCWHVRSALYLFAVSMVGGLCGQYIIQSLVKLFGRSSIIIILLCVVTMMSAVILGILSSALSLSLSLYLGRVCMCMQFYHLLINFCVAYDVGGLGIQDAIKKLRMGEYLGFSSLC
jgi:hypothetical protein